MVFAENSEGRSSNPAFFGFVENRNWFLGTLLQVLETLALFKSSSLKMFVILTFIYFLIFL